MRVLVVEDDAGITGALEQVLAFDGHEVTVVRDGATALARLAQPPAPDVVLLDLALPAMGGREVLERVIADAAVALPPVIVMTAVPGDDRLPAPSAYRALLRKPFAVEEVLDLVRAVGCTGDGGEAGR